MREGQVLWLTPVILATWEAEIRRIMVQGHPGQKAGPYLKYPTHTKKQLVELLQWESTCIIS
jgi:hypothetical protein